MIDTHCHLTFSQLLTRVVQVLDDARSAGVAGAITVSTTSQDVLEAAGLARRFANVWFTSGVHPLNCDEPIDWPTVVAAAADPKCVAWGELGLDRHYDRPPFHLQQQVLHDQLAVISDSRIALPIVVHCRKAFDDLLPILRQSGLPADRFVFHCFTGNPDEARQVLDFGAWISFTGIVTFTNASAKPIREAARMVPGDRIMIETDAPFLTPEPHRKIRTNEPQYSIATARNVAALRSEPWDEFHARINANTSRFFGIDPADCVTSDQPKNV
ncbi:MAG: TatD family deoxyribonuclease [Planctomycetes bacterium]|nr:TatD family deoxyribonuclease [Planctomycetota bacterium]NOG54685.1 TatD family hydrolase [Planctomycetota bacterium]